MHEPIYDIQILNRTLQCFYCKLLEGRFWSADNGRLVGSGAVYFRSIVVLSIILRK
jgi:hypothetical protein